MDVISEDKAHIDDSVVIAVVSEHDISDYGIPISIFIESLRYGDGKWIKWGAAKRETIVVGLSHLFSLEAGGTSTFSRACWAFDVQTDAFHSAFREGKSRLRESHPEVEKDEEEKAVGQTGDEGRQKLESWRLRKQDSWHSGSVEAWRWEGEEKRMKERDSRSHGWWKAFEWQKPGFPSFRTRKSH